MNLNFATYPIVIALLWGGVNFAAAAELHLRRECQCDGALVTLGDVAEIYAASDVESARLAAIELFPAPAPGQSRTARAREIQDVLAQRGIDLRRNRLAGASAVAIYGPQNAAPAAAADGAPLKQQAEAKIVKYLRSEVDPDVAWRATVEPAALSNAEFRPDDTLVSVRGGRAPWVGAQRFTAIVSDGRATREISIAARVTRPAGVVVPIRPLARGEVVQASDVVIQSADGAAGAGAAANLEDVVGQAAVRSLPAGRPLQASDVRPPVLVKRGSTVTVFARTRGVQVRTSAKALEDGARDDLIKLESLLDRDQVFVARVIGNKEVEVFAGRPRIESAAAPTAAPASAVSADDGAASNNGNSLGATQRHSLFRLRVQGTIPNGSTKSP